MLLHPPCLSPLLFDISRKKRRIEAGYENKIEKNMDCMDHDSADSANPWVFLKKTLF